LVPVPLKKKIFLGQRGGGRFFFVYFGFYFKREHAQKKKGPKKPPKTLTKTQKNFPPQTFVPAFGPLEQRGISNPFFVF